jgi:Flp pilus assembly pilin Flp
MDGEGENVKQLLLKIWNDEQGQDIAEYAVMLAVILVIVIGTVRLIGTSANNVFNNVGSTLSQ